MRKKLLVLAMAAIVGASSLPAVNISARTTALMAAAKDDEEDADADDLEDDSDDVTSGELTAGDIVASPAKKTIKVGKSFTINLSPSDESEFEDLPDEEWDDLIDSNIDGITFRSTKSSIAYVNKKGKVTGKKKGKAVIKTTVTFSDGSENTYKTTVYVTK